MQLIIASLIIGAVILVVGMALVKFVKLDMRNRMANNELRIAAQDLLDSDNKPTKIERATAEAQAKVKLKLALKKHEARLNEMREANVEG